MKMSGKIDFGRKESVWKFLLAPKNHSTAAEKEDLGMGEVKRITLGGTSVRDIDLYHRGTGKKHIGGKNTTRALIVF